MSTRVSSLLGGTPDLGVQVHPVLAAHVRYFEKHVAELHAETERAITKYRRELPERQLVVERLANMAIDLYATAASIARTQRLIEQRGPEAAQHEIALTDLFSVTAGRRFRENRLALSGREDEVDDTRRRIAASMREAAGYVVDDPVLNDASTQAPASPRPPTDHTAPEPARR
jgi:acyl-CoA dehydrogenase family protein 9